MRRRPSLIPLGIMGLILVAGLVMLWRGSLRRPLDDAELEAYLGPDATERETHHACEEMTRRAERGDPGRTKFHPAMIALASHKDSNKRKVVAWAMGWDKTEPRFRDALRILVNDPVPIVAQNAAIALASHGSDDGRPVLLAMLRPWTVVAPVGGSFRPLNKVGDTAQLLAPLGVITAAHGEEPVPAPVPGRVLSIAAADTRVATGDVIATLAAAQSNALKALGALTLPGIGRAEDAEVVDAFLKATPDVDKQVSAQAQETLKALRAR